MKYLTITLLTSILVIFTIGCSKENIETSKEVRNNTESTIVQFDESIDIYEYDGLLPEFNLDTLYSSDTIIKGTVQQILPTKNIDDGKRPMNITDVIIKVDSVIKGQDFNEIVIRRPGGIAEAKGKKIQVNTLAPHYNKGEQVLLFLESAQDDKVPPKGYNQEQYFTTVNLYGKWIHKDGNNYSFSFDDETIQINSKEVEDFISNHN